ncbi:hypothetical protein [Paraburkholderia sp.]|uniref:hypothetical protein n=1 Tax=Paraburkholderia sp. TaxID=1926495 RepID=UPI0039E65654
MRLWHVQISRHGFSPFLQLDVRSLIFGGLWERHGFEVREPVARKFDRVPFQEPFVNTTELSLTDHFTATEKQLLSEGLGALLRERSVAYEIAERVAISHGVPRPDVADFGIPDILRLSRTIQEDCRAVCASHCNL